MLAELHCCDASVYVSVIDPTLMRWERTNLHPGSKSVILNLPAKRNDKNMIVKFFVDEKLLLTAKCLF